MITLAGAGSEAWRESQDLISALQHRYAKDAQPVILNQGAIVPTIHITIDGDDVNVGDPLNQFEGPQEKQGCCGAGEKIDHDHATAVHLAHAVQHLRLAHDHASDQEIEDMIADAERLAAEYLAAAG